MKNKNDTIDLIDQKCRNFWRENPERATALQRMCGNYYEATLFVLIYLFEEIGTSHTHIKKIIKHSFGYGWTYTHHIVQCYKGNPAAIFSDRSRNTKDFNFHPGEMRKYCKKRVTEFKDHVFDVPDDILEHILMLSNNALTVCSIVSAQPQKNGLQTAENVLVTENLQRSAKQKLKKMDEVFTRACKAIPSVDFWRQIIEFSDVFLHDGLLQECIVIFPMLEEDLVKRKIRNSSPQKALSDVKWYIQKMQPLLRCAEELERLEKKPVPIGTTVKNEIMELLQQCSLTQLNDVVSLTACIEKMIRRKLRPVDLYLTYELLVNYNLEWVRFFLDELIYDNFFW